MLTVLRAKLGQVLSMRFLGYFVLASFVFIIFFWHISSLTPGLSAPEAAARSGSSSLSLIYDNPINAPHKLLQMLFIKIHPHSLVSLKMSTVIFACIFGFCFYKLASCWFGKLIGLFGSLIFISMPLFIISSRQATSQIMLFSPIVLLWLYAWLNKNKSNVALVWFLLVIAVGILVYTPGLLWFVLASIVVCRKQLKQKLAEISPVAVGASFITLGLIILPLLASGFKHPDIIKRLLLIPYGWPSVVHIAKNLGWSVLSLFARTQTESPLFIARLPVLSVIVIALIVFGLYAMQAAARAKTLWLVGLIIFAIVVAGLNNNVLYLALCIPAACLLASAGLRYLYIEWRTIFPRNPVPKTFALVLIALLTATQVYFGVRYSLVAWPHSVATRNTYVLK